MANKNIALMNAVYNDVPAVQLPISGGGTATFTEITDTTAEAADVATGKYFYTAAGVRTQGTNSGGGGGGPTLLGTKSLGTISTSSTTAADIGQTMTVSGIDSYDLLIIETSVDTKTNGRHVGTTRLVWLTAGETIGTKNGTALATATWNAKLSSAGTATSRQSTTAYGIYPYSLSISNGSVTITIYRRYNSTQTGTINGSYTMRVYGVKIYE